MEQKKTSSWPFVLAIMNAWAATIYFCMRERVGRRHPHLPVLIGCGWIWLWVAHTGAERLIWLIPLLLLGLCLHNIQHQRNLFSVHSNYGGDPIIAIKLGFKDERVAKAFGEPLISFTVGAVMLANGFQEGKYFAFGALAMVVTNSINEMQQRRRVEEMRDGMIEGRYLMGQMKGRR